MTSPRKRLSRRADAAGILAGGTSVPVTFQRTLMPRTAADQAIITGLSISTNQALVTLTQESINAAVLALVRERGATLDSAAWRRIAMALNLGSLGTGLAAQRALRQRPGEPLGRAGMRTAGFWMSVTGAAGAMIGGLDDALRLGERGSRRSVPALAATTGVTAALTEWGRRRRARLDADLPEEELKVATARALAFGLGVSGGTTALAAVERRAANAIARTIAKLLPGDSALWQPVGHAVTLGALVVAGRYASHLAFTRIETQQGGVETAFDIAPPSPLLSGSYESHVPFASLSLQGRRYVWMVTPYDIIEKVTGEHAVMQPIRAYVGLESAPTEEERVELAIRELDRTNAFDRKWLMIVSPTGTGYVNYAAVSALEFLARGDCATVAMQYAARPSVLSLRRVSEGRAHMQLLLAAIKARVAARPADQRPKVVLFGESLGAWTSQDPFVGQGTQGLADAGVDYAIWIGTPHFSKWKEQVLHDDRVDVDRSIVGVFNDIDEWRALDASERAALRYVMITHHDDGVALFGPELAIQAPEWLGPPDTRPTKIPKGMRWMPTTTFFQVLVDMKNSANVVPGVFDAKGHDYRADLLPFFHDVLGFDESPEVFAAIEQWLEERELMRTEWVREHGDAGRSLAVSVLERLMEQERAAGHDPDAALLRVVRDVAAAEQTP